MTSACVFAYQAALGLRHAHERGMVHRDIKPANLILARDGKKAVVKVLDFGLAKVAVEGPLDGGLTHEGQMLGTPDFIAPEQTVDAQGADIRADIYSLGCTVTAARRPAVVWPGPSPLATEAGPTPPSSPMKAGGDVVAWGELITFAEDEPLSARKPRADAAARPRPPWLLPVLLAAPLLAALLVVVYVATDTGRIRIVLSDPSAGVRIDGRAVEIESPGRPLTLRAGEHTRKARRGTSDARSLTIRVRRGGDDLVEVSFEPAAAEVVSSSNGMRMARVSS